MVRVTSGFTYENLKRYTNDFSEDNFIGKFQFGKVYRGVYQKNEVTVKIWEDPLIYEVRPGDNFSRLIEEVDLLDHFSSNEYHPNLVKLIGFCPKGEHLCVVYKLKSLDTVHNLIPKDSFTWLQRIKVALGFASVLEFMHTCNFPYLPYLLRNVDAAHIMLDQDHNPILYDFSMISGGLLTDKRNLPNQYVHGCYGYIDPSHMCQGDWSEKCDVFAYGVVLLGLITKRVYTEEDSNSHAPFVYEWAKNVYNPQKSFMGHGRPKSSLVHQSLEAGCLFDSSDGIKLSKLAMQCVEFDPRKRPTMKQVVRCLLTLSAVQHHTDAPSTGYIRNGDNAIPHIDNLSVSSRLMPKGSDFQLRSCCSTGRIGSISPIEIFSPWICQLASQFHLPCERIIYRGQRSPNLIQAGKEYDKIEVFSYDDLNLFTDGFSEENFIGKFQFGKVYRGKIEERKVTVKIWRCSEFEIYPVIEGDNERRLRDELILLQHPKLVHHPNLVKLIGYCFEGEHRSIVYDLKPLDTVRNLLLKDNFTWVNRVKVALGFARLLKFLHARNPPYLPYLVRNITPAHIMLDEDHNPKLFDFGMFTGGVLPDRRFPTIKYLHGCCGYVDINYARTDYWSEYCDIFAFGVVLLNLITKRFDTEEDCERAEPIEAFEWAQSEYELKMSVSGSKLSKCSLVHENLKVQPGCYSSDGAKLTKLALKCVEYDLAKRPKMKQIVKKLLKLRVVKELF